VKANPFKSHLFWFLLCGALIFLIDAYSADSDTEIVVDQAVVTRIASLWESQMKRAPTQQELSGLIDDWVEEEMLYREAVRLQLDENDVIVRRRLVQKVNFIAQESDSSQPTESQVRAWYDKNNARYELAPRYSFRQVFFKSPTSSQELRVKLETQPSQWRAFSEASLLQPAFQRRNARQIQTALGAEFVDQIEKLSTADDWQGPLKSEFGWHYVQLLEVLPVSNPSYGNISRRVINDYIYESQENARERYLQKLSGDYSVSWRVSQ